MYLARVLAFYVPEPLPMDDLDTDAASSVVALLTGAEAARATIAGSRIVDADAWRTLTRRDFGCTTPNYRELTTSRVIAFGPDDESGFLGREPVSPFPHALAPTVPPPHHPSPPATRFFLLTTTYSLPLTLTPRAVQRRGHESSHSSARLARWRYPPAAYTHSCSTPPAGCTRSAADAKDKEGTRPSYPRRRAQCG